LSTFQPGFGLKNEEGRQTPCFHHRIKPNAQRILPSLFERRKKVLRVSVTRGRVEIRDKRLPFVTGLPRLRAERSQAPD